MSPSPDVYEKLGVFYLGRRFDLESAKLNDDLVLYDSKDLTTHALCVGMTGSGKTGLCLSLLEEAAIDGIPAIAVDPKGDLANLLLTFPQLQAADFQPWLETGEATRKGMTLEQLAQSKAKLWQDGLASWGQAPDRIQRFKDAVDVTIYTPGSSAGVPLTVLRGFDAPSEKVRGDADLMRERVTAATSGLLSLLGLDAVPLTSREHILLSSILDLAWRQGRGVPLGDLIAQIQSPPFPRVGVIDLETFMPVTERAKLAMQLNNLLASPAFSTWLDGEPLNIQNLLYTPEGKPRLSILSISHLSDRERMFFVTILLGELISWMRSQSGTSSLRALFYMDEVFGYFPPVANPPSKGPMLTLLKQARAFGLGIALATQNPVDLDYKGLSNIGTWMLGRLQTERDKQRVLEGLEGAAAQGGRAFDRQKMEQTLAGLGNRVFLMNNVHEDGPFTFQTRWALSFLAGPMARDQIARLMEPKKQKPNEGDQSLMSSVSTSQRGSTRGVASSASIKPSRPIVPAGITEQFAAVTARPPVGDALVYRPALIGHGQLHFVKASAKVDVWQDVTRLVECYPEFPKNVWNASRPMSALYFSETPEEGISFVELPAPLCGKANYRTWTKELKDYLYREQTLELFFAPALDAHAPPGVNEGQARIELSQKAREVRDLRIEAIRAKYDREDAALAKRVQTAKEKLDREKAQYDQAKWSSVAEIGASILGGLLGNKRSRYSSTRTSAAAKGVGRATQERSEMLAAEDALKELQREIEYLNQRAKDEAAEITRNFDPQQLQLTTEAITPRKADLKVDDVSLLWLPWRIDRQGASSPAF